MTGHVGPRPVDSAVQRSPLRPVAAAEAVGMLVAVVIQRIVESRRIRVQDIRTVAVPVVPAGPAVVDTGLVAADTVEGQKVLVLIRQQDTGPVLEGRS